jgi:hypothetical protein
MRKILAGLIAASLAVVSCGGDDGGIDSNDRDALIEMFTAEGNMTQEVAECMADATVDTMSDEDMKSIMAGGDPSAESEAAFTEAIMPCIELEMGS